MGWLKRSGNVHSASRNREGDSVASRQRSECNLFAFRSRVLVTRCPNSRSDFRSVKANVRWPLNPVSAVSIKYICSRAGSAIDSQNQTGPRSDNALPFGCNYYFVFRRDVTCDAMRSNRIDHPHQVIYHSRIYPVDRSILRAFRFFPIFGSNDRRRTRFGFQNRIGDGRFELV